MENPEDDDDVELLRLLPLLLFSLLIVFVCTLVCVEGVALLPLSLLAEEEDDNETDDDDDDDVIVVVLVDKEFVVFAVFILLSPDWLAVLPVISLNIALALPPAACGSFVLNDSLCAAKAKTKQKHKLLLSKLIEIKCKIFNKIYYNFFA